MIFFYIFVDFHNNFQNYTYKMAIHKPGNFYFFGSVPFFLSLSPTPSKNFYFKCFQLWCLTVSHVLHYCQNIQQFCSELRLQNKWYKPYSYGFCATKECLILTLMSNFQLLPAEKQSHTIFSPTHVKNFSFI